MRLAIDEPWIVSTTGRPSPGPASARRSIACTTRALGGRIKAVDPIPDFVDEIDIPLFSRHWVSIAFGKPGSAFGGLREAFMCWSSGATMVETPVAVVDLTQRAWPFS
ncbi:hypothetical protein KRM28CT15_60090 [Krasilnikovia sp. M28-CT-15]